MLSAEIFKQKIPCESCPFRRDGGVRHSRPMLRAYASYFLSEPGVTFPCHKSVPKDDPRTAWSPWQPGQVLCVGGLLLARKQGVENGVVRYGKARGWYDPAEHTAEQLALVFDDVDQMVQGV